SAFVPASFIDAAGIFLKVNAGVALSVSLCSIATLISPRESAAWNRRAVMQSALISIQFRLSGEAIELSRFNIGNAREWQAPASHMHDTTPRHFLRIPPASSKSWRSSRRKEAPSL